MGGGVDTSIASGFSFPSSPPTQSFFSIFMLSKLGAGFPGRSFGTQVTQEKGSFEALFVLFCYEAVGL